MAEANPWIFQSLRPEYTGHLARKGPDVDFRDSDDVVLRYYPQVIKFIKGVTGAKEVFPFDHNLRFANQDDTKVAGSAQKVQRPIGKVHTDYTIHSAPRRLLDLIRPPTSNDTWSKYLQVWMGKYEESCSKDYSYIYFAPRYY